MQVQALRNRIRHDAPPRTVPSPRLLGENAGIQAGECGDRAKLMMRLGFRAAAALHRELDSEHFLFHRLGFKYHTFSTALLPLKWFESSSCCKSSI